MSDRIQPGELNARGSSWLCEGAGDRERMLDMEHRLRPVRTGTVIALAGGLLVCGPWIGYWAVLPLVVGAACFVIGDYARKRTAYPEYAMMGAWLAAQISLGVGVAVTGGPASPALPLLAVPIVSLSARFSLRGVIFGVAATLGIMALATLGVDATQLFEDPPLTILAAVLVVSVGALSTALMRSDVHHRGEAVLDQLTGMLNRKALRTRASELEQQSRVVNQPVGVIVADIDHFKRVNDERGHPEGDAVLTDVAYVLRKELRAFDLAYRIGGEEFLMLLPGADVRQARVVAEGLRAAVANTPVGSALQITMSFGVAGSQAGEPFEYEAVFAAADEALYDAKRSGRNQVQSRGPASRASADQHLEAKPALTGAASGPDS